jgi:hypothetical protein
MRPGGARVRIPVMAARQTAATGGDGASLLTRFAALFHGVPRLSPSGRKRASWGVALVVAVDPGVGVVAELETRGPGAGLTDA